MENGLINEISKSAICMEHSGREIPGPEERLIDSVVKLAQEYEKITGRKMGITGEVGEVRTCKLLSLTLAPFNEKGYDATGSDNKRYQIKTRRKTDHPKSGKVPSFKNEDFHIAVLTMLDENYLIDSVWMLPRPELRSFLSGNDKKRINIGQFQNLCKEKGSSIIIDEIL